MTSTAVAGPGSFAVRRRALSPSVPTPPPAGARTPRTFTAEQILDAVRAWTTLYGSPPLLADWEPSRARRAGHAWRVERFEAGRWPTIRMVRRHFGSLGEAIAAAGFERPRAPAGKGHLVGADEVLRAIRAWTVRYGEPPCQADWDPVRARALHQSWRAARYREGDWPSLATVRHHHGSLGAGIRAAGLVPPAVGDTHADRLSRRRANHRAVAAAVAADAPLTGPSVLTDALRAVAEARRTEDRQALHEGLVGLAAAALGWADGLAGGHAPAA